MARLAEALIRFEDSLSQKSSSAERSSNFARSPFAEAAAELRRAGLVVVPCGGPTDKAPLVRWCQLRDPIPLRTMKVWLKNPKFTGANIGIVTGPSGLTVIDCDTLNSLDQLINRFGPTPLMVATPRGGYHLYYKSGGERCGRIDEGGLHIDVKASGGFVVAPPSIRRTGEHIGKGYEFICGAWADISALTPVKADSLPTNFYDRPLDGNRTAGRVGAGRNLPGQPLTGGCDIGRRNTALFDRLRSVALAVESLHQLAQVANVINAAFYPPLAPLEVDQTVRSVWNYKQQSRLFVAGQSALVVPTNVFDTLAALPNGADALLLLACLLKNHGARCQRGQDFSVVPSAMARAKVLAKWGIDRYRNATETLLKTGLIILTYRGGAHRGDAHKYMINTHANI